MIVYIYTSNAEVQKSVFAIKSQVILLILMFRSPPGRWKTDVNLLNWRSSPPSTSPETQPCQSPGSKHRKHVKLVFIPGLKLQVMIALSQSEREHVVQQVFVQQECWSLSAVTVLSIRSVSNCFSFSCFLFML